MKVAIVHSYYSSRTPSGENAVVDAQASALAQAGHEVTIVCRRTDDMERERLYSLRAAWNVAFERGDDLSASIGNIDPDIVHAHNLFPNIGVKWVDKVATPIVTTLHNFRPICAAGILYRDGNSCTLCPDRGSHNAVIHRCYRNSAVASLPLAISTARPLPRNRLIRRSNALVVLSPRSFETYQRYGLDTSKSTIIPNFADPSIESDGRRGQSWAFVGRISPEKGLVELLSDWPVSAPLDIFGTGPQESLAREVAAGKNVTFHGSVPREKIYAGLRSVAGLVIPSLCAEGLPTVYLEALSTGTPVLVRTGNSAADDVIAGRHGLTYRSNSELRQKIKAVEKKAEQFGSLSKKRFAEEFSRDKWIERMTELYRRVLESPHSGLTESGS